jgi:NAD-specific glutamate dehydrogenase
MREIERQRRRLDDVFQKVRDLSWDAELQAHWARYLCILTSGFIETSVRTIYLQYAEQKSAPYVASYVESQLSRFQNPRMERIIQLASAFNPRWGDEIRSNMADELKDAIDSIVSLRNRRERTGR